jgi:hypothetical protein
VNKKWYGIGSSKSHEKFMEQLYANNSGYREGLFRVVGKFKGGKSKVILKDNYGYCAVSAYDLTRGVTQKMTIKSAIFKTQYLKEYLRQSNKNFYKHNSRIISEYEQGKKDIIAIDSLGILHKIKPSSLFNGCNLSIKSALDRDDFLFRKICSRNKHFKSGEIKYVSSFIKNQSCFIRVSDEFGEYIMDVSVAYTGSKPTIEVAVNRDENLVNRLKQNGGDYDYSNVTYTKMDDKVIICCDKHECFQQRPANHVRGDGCPKCGTQSMLEINSINPTGWTYTNWINAGKRSKKFESFKVYVVKMQSLDGSEEFYKIGKTFLTIRNRFKNIKNYKVCEVLKIFESEDGRDMTEKEAELLKENKDFKYKPKNNFGGYMECFSKVEYD